MKTLVLTLVFLALAQLAGCATDPVTGMSWRTEAYTVFHEVPVVEHPQTPEQWQARYNAQCVEDLLSVRLPDGNYAWKYSRGMTVCVYGWQYHMCNCEGPQPLKGPTPPPNHAAIYYEQGWVRMSW